MSIWYGAIVEKEGNGRPVPSFIYMKEYAKEFYKSKAWKQTQAAYKKSVGGLCERCRHNGLVVPGVIVHHKIHITPENIKEPLITLSFDNLELLCRDCHAKAHAGTVRRWKVDGLGRITAKDDCLLCGN